MRVVFITAAVGLGLGLALTFLLGGSGGIGWGSGDDGGEVMVILLMCVLGGWNTIACVTTEYATMDAC